MPDDPYAGLEAELAALRRTVAAYFGALSSSIPAAKIDAAASVGSANPVLNSRQWTLAAARLTAELKIAEKLLLAVGLSQGIELLPRGAPALSARIGVLAEELGGRKAVELAQAIDAATRAGIRRAIGGASRAYASDQSLSTLRRLRAEIRSMIGLTEKQAARIEAWRVGAQASALTADEVTAGVEERAAAAIDLRAGAIADRGVIESVSYGRHQSWVEAVKSGDLPRTAKKQWTTQHDRSVRPLHQKQEEAGPIPLETMYLIMNVMHAPSHEFG